MALITADEMYAREMIPLVVYDANGMFTRGHITAFDADTGFVESLVLDADGLLIVEGEDVKRRQEFFPAPLLWRKVERQP